AMFRNRNQLLRFKPADGTQVLVRARISLYEARGDYQLIVEHMEEAGDGALQRAFEALKQRLAAEGLFDPARKRPLPVLPRRIGVITSPTGAAIRDILSVLARRFPAIPVLIYPVPVQGEGAGARIAAALRRAGTRGECDVLILARGGGSLEDLWAFNEEAVARALYDSPIPVVSGVGHEVDITIADFAADHRAATPSAAAEAVSPDGQAWLQQLLRLDGRLLTLLHQRQRQAHQALDSLGRRLQAQHPGQRLRQRAQRLDELDQRLRRGLERRLARVRTDLAQWQARLRGVAPAPRLARLAGQHVELKRRLHAALEHRLEQRRQALKGLARALDTVSPLATLARGYSITSRVRDGVLLRAAGEVEVGEEIETRLADGGLISTVQRRIGQENT
ncbi:MAG: exodeoxyribonuclease VII large subunit, partial [Xanthomonadaceae bacterium]|nr:exodeoxyribonuclease VII large subunit [Xanthomonadaceae bacterium]